MIICFKCNLKFNLHKLSLKSPLQISFQINNIIAKGLSPIYQIQLTFKKENTNTMRVLVHA